MPANTELISGVEQYVTTATTAIVGSQNNNSSLVADLSNRLFGKTLEGVKFAMEESDFYALNFLVGSSYGVAGSAAYTLRDKKATLPHNSFSEIYLVGGCFLLLLFIKILFNTLNKIWINSVVNPKYKPWLICFLLMIAFLPTYPIIYEPIIGSLFWLLIGVAANPNFSANKNQLTVTSLSVNL
jgi:hypothetical protein